MPADPDPLPVDPYPLMVDPDHLQADPDPRLYFCLTSPQEYRANAKLFLGNTKREKKTGQKCYFFR